MMAVKVAFVTLSLTFIFNTLFYLDYMKEVFRRISGVFIKFEKGVVRMIKTILNKLRGGGAEPNSVLRILSPERQVFVCLLV